MPAAVGERLQQLIGSPYVEGYGLTETIAPTHINPPRSAEAAVPGHPDLQHRLAHHRSGHAAGSAGRAGRRDRLARSADLPRLLAQSAGATDAAFIELDGKRFFRTGDLGYVDEDGYFFLVDRLKRMINASGYKVWPAEVEAQMYQHPAIQEACVIAAKDAHRGETVKAVVVLRPSHKGKVTESDIIEWTRQNMAVYKHPRVIEFVDALPKSATGKVQWRALQEAELARAATRAHG